MSRHIVKVIPVRDEPAGVVIQVRCIVVDRRAWSVATAMSAVRTMRSARDAVAVMRVTVMMLMRWLPGLRRGTESDRQPDGQETDLCQFYEHVNELRYSILISKMRRGHHAKGNRFLLN